MNNLTEINVDEKTQNLIQNEKEESIIDIEESPKVLNSNKEIVKRINNLIEVKGIDHTNFQNPTSGFLEKCEQKDGEKSTTFKHDGTEKKPPEIWVQYNQAYDQGQRHGQGQEYGQIQGHGQSPQYNSGGGQDYGGATMEYDPESRNYFVRFVFMLLFVMLSITAAAGLTINAVPVIKEFYQIYGLLLIIFSMVVLVGLNYVMACSACSRVPPCNFISLVLVVIAMSNLVGAVTVRYRTHILLFAVLATLIIVTVCMLLACSNFDFTKWYLYIVVIAVAFAAISLMVSIAMLVMGIRYKPFEIVMLFGGSLIQIVVLIMELQMILGGGAIEIGEEDYALAAYMLYTSIVDIFLKMVQLIGHFDD